MTTENSFTINLTTLTPIWTGGADGRSSRLHITGIMGSLRWWYEVIVRGLGGWACDPTDPKGPRCSYDDKKPETFNEVCDVCRIFGATGWARRFRIILLDEKELQLKNPLQPDARYVKPFQRIEFEVSESRKQEILKKEPPREPPKWYLKGPPLFGNVEMKIIATGPKEPESNSPFELKVIDSLFQFIEEWGSLGAKPQMGLGVVQITSPRDREGLLKYLYDFVTQDIKAHVAIRQKKRVVVPKSNPNLPSLQNMFFARINTPATSLPTSIHETFDLRNELRDEVFREKPPEGETGKPFRESYAMRDLRHQVMGDTRGDEPIGAKVLMSYPDDQGIIRMWGWLPEDIGHAKLKIRGYMEEKYGVEMVTWHPFDRTTHGDGAGFLKELCVKEEK